MFVKGSCTEGSLAIGAPLCVHLKQAQIDAKLNFFLTILSDEFPHHDLAGMIFPFVQDVRNVKIHCQNMNRGFGEVNASCWREEGWNAPSIRGFSGSLD